MKTIEEKTCDTCTHRGSCDKAELGKPACVSYQVGYKKVVLAKIDTNNYEGEGMELLQYIKEMVKLGVILVDKSLDISVIEVPENFTYNDIIVEIHQKNK